MTYTVASRHGLRCATTARYSVQSAADQLRALPWGSGCWLAGGNEGFSGHAAVLSFAGSSTTWRCSLVWSRRQRSRLCWWLGQPCELAGCKARALVLSSLCVLLRYVQSVRGGSERWATKARKSRTGSESMTCPACLPASLTPPCLASTCLDSPPRWRRTGRGGAEHAMWLGHLLRSTPPDGRQTSLGRTSTSACHGLIQHACLRTDDVWTVIN